MSFRLFIVTSSSTLFRYGNLSAAYIRTGAEKSVGAAYITRPASPLVGKQRTMSSASTLYDFTPKDKKGDPFPVENLRGKVVLVVNTASKCGFTPQYEGLEQLYKNIKANSSHGQDFEILAFPCNQFANQDPGDNDSIQNFCQVNYGVTFPVLGKTDVNGSNADPLWEWMKKEQPGLMGMKRIKWNFEKFLIGRDGKVKQRWASTAKPATLQAPIEKELNDAHKI